MINWQGTAYRLHPLFILLMIASVATGYFIELIALFGIVFIHEMGHVACAKGFGWKVAEVQVLPFGGVAVIDPASHVTAWQEVAVALAGPFQHLWMIGLTLILMNFGIWDEAWGHYFIHANAIIGLFNLLPILPLDGGKVLQALLSLRFSYHRTLLFCAAEGMVFSITFIASSLIHSGGAGLQFNLLLIGLFLLYSNWYGYRNRTYHFMRFLVHREQRADEFVRAGTAARLIVVHRTKTVAQVARLFVRGKYHLVYVVGDHGVIQAVLPEHRLIHTYFQENRPGSAVSDLFMLK